MKPPRLLLALAAIVLCFTVYAAYIGNTPTPTELGYVSGVSSAIQTQLNAKQSTTAPGTDTQIIFKDGTAFAGAAAVTWNKTTSIETVGNLTVSTNLQVNGVTIINPASIGTFTPGLILTNTGLATASVTVSNSPLFIQQGNAWLSGSASNAPVATRMYLVPATGGSSPSFNWLLDGSLNGAAFANILTMSSGGDMTIPGLFNAGAGQMIRFTGKSGFRSSADGALEANNNGSTARATVQANQPQLSKTTNYTVVALDSGLTLADIGAGAAHTNTLPTAVAGMQFRAYLDTAQITSLKAAGSDVIHNGVTASSTGGDIWSTTQFSTIHLYCPKALIWVVESVTGTWAVN